MDRYTYDHYRYDAEERRKRARRRDKAREISNDDQKQRRKR